MSDFYVAPSKIHGRGIHAARNFKPDEYIGHVATAVDKSSSGYDYFETKMSKHLGTKIERTELERYLNHSQEPNAKCQASGAEIKLFATKPIQKGEEIAVDYVDAYRELDKAQIIVSR